MLEKLAKQTAIYGISTIVVRFLNYLLTPYFTRVFDPGVYGITVDVYALIPFALVILTMGMESGYFRFAAKADEAGGDVTAAKRRLFATTWGITSLAALLFFGLVTLFRTTVSKWMGADYAANPDFVVWVAAIIFLDVCTAIPFARLREQGRALTYVGFKALSVVITVVLAVAFGLAGFYETSFGVGWVFVGNLIASLLTLLAILTTTNRTLPRIDGKLLRRAADGQRHRRHGQRIHIPPDDQVPRTGRCDGRSGYLRSDRQNRYGAHAFRADVPVGRRTLLPGRL
jgi:O-antigen/teichoic acid export membrane protein